MHRYSITGIESLPYSRVEALLSDSSAPVVRACVCLRLKPHLRSCTSSGVLSHDGHSLSVPVVRPSPLGMAFMRTRRPQLANACRPSIATFHQVGSYSRVTIVLVGYGSSSEVGLQYGRHTTHWIEFGRSSLTSWPTLLSVLHSYYYPCRNSWT